MYLDLIIKSFIIGLIMALPAGPVGMLSVRRALAYGRRAGFASGLGSSFADVPYIALAGLGTSGFSRELLAHGHWLRVAGLLVIGYVGIRLVTESRNAGGTLAPAGCGKMFASAFVLSVSNPTILISAVALVAAASLPVAAGGSAILLLVIAAASGSAVWWAGFSLIIDRSRTLMSEAILVKLTKFAALAVIVLAVAGLFSS